MNLVQRLQHDKYKLPKVNRQAIQEAIELIDRLPRCNSLHDNGHILEDCPVVIGHTNLYAVLTDGDLPNVKMYRFGTIAMQEDHDRENSWIVECRDEDGEEFELPLHRCCNSEEAAWAMYKHSFSAPTSGLDHTQ